MTTVDLITGFLGSGKTTFMKKYVRYHMNKGDRVCILENDFGAVNVDTMLLQELYDDGCGMEMISGACDKDCHKRRFKTKLIAMAMTGYDRVVIEPSGIFDVDEFFDTLHESPLDKWYKIGTVITVVDPTIETSLSYHSDYLLASQCAVAGTIVFSHTQREDEPCVQETLEHIRCAMKKIRCERDPAEYYISTPWSMLSDENMNSISQNGFKEESYVKLHSDSETYGSVYFMNTDPTPQRLRKLSSEIMNDKQCGDVFRIKGFTICDGKWYEINATHKCTELHEIAVGQSVIIVIGENLKNDVISKYFDEKTEES